MLKNVGVRNGVGAPFRKTHLESFGVITTKESDEWTAPVRRTYSLYGSLATLNFNQLF